jgi:hypothetical protein
MHYLRDYAQAVAHAAKIKPLRGDAKARKPYGDRRHGRTFYITDEGPNGVAVTLYSTVIVRFMPDGTIRVDGTYRSQTTRKALWEVLGSWASLINNKIWIATNKGREPLLTDKPTPMFRAFDGGLGLVEPNPVIIHRIDRKAMNAVWRRYAAFRDYLNVTLSLGGEKGYSQAHVAAVLGTKPTLVPRKSIATIGNPHTRVPALHLVQMMRPEADPEVWAKAAMELLLVRNSYYALHFDNAPSSTKHITYTDAAYVMENLRDVLRHAYRDEVFKEVEAPAGEIVRDRYGSYFSS